MYVFSYYQSNTLSQKSFTPDKKERKTFVFSLEKTSVRETIAKINHCFFKNKKNMYKNVDDFLQFLQLLSSIENNGWTV